MIAFYLVWMFYVWMFVNVMFVSQFLASRCADNRVVNIMKAYNERNNMQVELICVCRKDCVQIVKLCNFMNGGNFEVDIFAK